jgi:hypothetical protein
VFFSSGGTEIKPSDAVTAAIVVKNPYFYHWGDRNGFLTSFCPAPRMHYYSRQ